MRRCAAALGVLCLASIGTQAAPASLHFEVDEGPNLNYFLRDGASAAHLVLRSGDNPRVLVAFPAGNSGVGLWFEHASTPVKWTLDAPPVAAQAQDTQGRTLHGITFETSVSAKSLTLRQGVLSSVRVLRDYQSSGTAPREVLVKPQADARTLSWSRPRLDGAPGYRLTLSITDGSLSSATRIDAGPDGRIRLRITALSGEPPLTPLSGAALFNGTEDKDPAARQTLTFLSYQEKLLAGSWRFDTYFGRDTLLSVRLLMPVLTPAAIEAGLGSVLTRLSPDGEVAHEEAIGEFAVLSHKPDDKAASDAPLLDYGMIDGNYLLAPVIAAYLLDTPQGRQRSRGYLAAPNPGGGSTAGQALLRNLRLVARNAGPFAADPRYNHLISLKPGHTAGQWRDSGDGIGGGRYPYDVNAILMPAALDATARLLTSGLLDAFLVPGDRTLLGAAAAQAAVWHRSAPALFEVTLDNTRARAAVLSYARELGVPASEALAALGAGPVTFHAISLEGSGRPVPVLNSDEGFALLLTSPAPPLLDAALTSVMRPFPLGLLTEAGMVVANPVFADEGLRARFSNHAYHGTVIWSWQQALLASGIGRQLGRTDLPEPVRTHLIQAQRMLWRVIQATRKRASSELWTWQLEGGHLHAIPFGARSTDVDESNAAQLWSSVYLAVRPPAGLSPGAATPSPALIQ